MSQSVISLPRAFGAPTITVTGGPPGDFAPGQTLYVIRSGAILTGLVAASWAGGTIGVVGPAAGFSDAALIVGDIVSTSPVAYLAPAASDTVDTGGRAFGTAIGGGGALTPTAKTTAYTAAGGDLVIANAAGGAFTVTLPTGQAAGTKVGVLKTDTGGNAVTVSRGGSDTIHGLTSGGQTSLNVRGEGDLIVLTVGTSGVWYVTDRVISPSYALVYASTSGQSFTSGVETAVQFDTDSVDADGLWSSGANTRITIKKAGKYQISGSLIWNDITACRTYAAIWKNGITTGTQLAVQGSITPAATGYPAWNVGAVSDCAAGDYLELSASQATGGAATLLTASGVYPTFEALRIGD